MATTKKTKGVLGKNYLKKMASGGDSTDPDTTSSPWTTANIVDTGSAVAGVGATAINALAPKDQWGVRSNGAALGSGALSGAATGAKAGMAFGPEGAIIGAGAGALIGGAEGILGNKSANAAKIKSIRASTLSQEQLTQSKGEATIAGNPNAKYGNLSASYYAMGGTMKGTLPQGPRLTKPLRPVQAMPRVMPPIADVPGRQMSRMGFGGTNPFDGNVSGTISPEMVGVPKHPKMKASNQGGHMGQGNLPPTPKSQRLPLQNPKRMADGGAIQPLSSQDTKVNGPSHANGGVKFPSAGVELEGGETVNNGFVFSKKLGFAQQQEKIAKRLGKVEKQPDSVVNRNTAQALQRQTEALKLAQESTKQQMGIPNEIDNTTQQMMQDQQSGQGLPSSGQLANGGYPKVPQYNIAKQTRPFRPQLYHDPVSKFADGGAIGDPKPKPKKAATINGVGSTVTNYDPSLLTNGKFMVDKGNGKMGQWGNDLKPVVAPVQFPIVKPVNNEVGNVNSNGYSIGDGTGGQSVPGQKPSANYFPYKMGGKMKRMDDGGSTELVDGPGPKKKPAAPSPFNGTMPGLYVEQASIPNLPRPAIVDPITSNSLYQQINKPVVTAPQPAAGTPTSRSGLRTGRATTTATGKVAPTSVTGMKFPLATGNPNDALNPGIPDPSTTVTPATTGNNSTAFPGSTAGATPPPAAQVQAQSQKTTGSKIANAANGIVPFLPNIGNALQKLPLPPKPIMESEIAPNLVDYSASKAEAVRATRGANKVAAQNLNTGAAVSATRAANLVAQDRAENQISEGENAQNAGIRNNNAAENLNVRARNNALQNNYNTQLTERQLKSQELQSQNLASISDKIQQMGRDKKLFDLEGEKSILGYLSNNDSGAGYDLIRPILQKHLSDDQLRQTDAWATKQKSMAAEDRAQNMAETKARIDALKRTGANKDDSNKSLQQVLRGKSIIPTDKEANDEDKTSITKKQSTS